ncbi:hypothetical protein NDU88_000317 [Pleurodeles waltl]|uniref:Uncharacterized protein n=1 Tax=Pleurodeles waltl TaxID=8319 RepID=A0AAV7TFE9_PLEWA|nr:hypothetical protein NDU88_000317 [Pleurodeles waltl]
MALSKRRGQKEEPEKESNNKRNVEKNLDPRKRVSLEKDSRGKPGKMEHKVEITPSLSTYFKVVPKTLILSEGTHERTSQEELQENALSRRGTLVTVNMAAGGVLDLATSNRYQALAMEELGEGDTTAQ